MVDHLRQEFAAETGALAGIRDVVRRWARRCGFGQARIDRLVTAINEAVSNAVEHAYAGRPHGSVLLDMQCREREAVVRVEDHGTWRSPAHLSNGATPAGQYRGHGLALMEGMVDRVDIQTRRTGGTVVTLTDHGRTPSLD